MFIVYQPLQESNVKGLREGGGHCVGFLVLPLLFLRLPMKCLLLGAIIIPSPPVARLKCPLKDGKWSPELRKCEATGICIRLMPSSCRWPGCFYCLKLLLCIILFETIPYIFSENLLLSVIAKGSQISTTAWFTGGLAWTCLLVLRKGGNNWILIVGLN